MNAGSNLGSLAIDEAAGGSDTLDFSGSSSAVTVELASAEEQTVNSNLTLMLTSGESIENVIGTSGSDRLSGNELANSITGGAGNDMLTGGGGDDVYLFGANFGADTISEESGASSGGFDSIDTTAIAGDTTVRKLSDGTYSLLVSGGSLAFANVERLLVGSGTNTLDYSSASAGVFVNLSTHFADDFTNVNGFRNVVGTSFDDTLVGNDLPNVLSGGQGNDLLTGLGGSDTIDGGTGFDVLSEVRDVSFTLTNTNLVVSGGASETDQLAGIDTASLGGGLSANVLDASAFKPLLPTSDLAGLNLGAGVDLAANDLVVHLTDGSSANVNLAGASTIQDVLNAINAASSRLAAALSAESNAIVVTQTSGNGGGSLTFSSVSTLAADLGLNVPGSGATLRSRDSIATGVILDGGSTVPQSALNNGNGVRTTNLATLPLLGNESTTPLAVLNQGADVRTVAGNDFQITLTDGQTVNVDLNSGMTLQQALDAIMAAGDAVSSGRITIEVDPQDESRLILKDTFDGGGDLTVTPLNGSFAAEDLGISGSDVGPTIEGFGIGTLSADLRLTLTDGGRIDIDLSGSPNSSRRQ